ncbi:unnamed protein product [Gongylonema pulchrum]|uniref:FAD_SOX domain-containing protein n=1 Tax=Gongylonema pulchrum TaxID=637853 RepID=A0A183EGL6_9BILA|nr:unnamed protein product [Gongylonema pulchrum]
MADIMTALHYILTAEIPRKAIMKGENLTALKQWVHALKMANNWIKDVPNEVTAEQWLAKVKEIQEQLGHPLPKNTTYMACRGSKPHLRGFSCGVWTIIHAMSAQAYKLEQNRDGVLWLWRTHNIVNKFIAKTPTDDPAFPKHQFPSASLCPSCRKADGEFDEAAVLNFLVNYYGDLKADGLMVSPLTTLLEQIDQLLFFHFFFSLVPTTTTRWQESSSSEGCLQADWGQF